MATKKDKGYIKLNRSILETELWQDKPFDKARAWVDLLLLASWKDHDEIYRGRIAHRKRGEVNCSIRWLADRWGWSVNKVKRYLDLLSGLGMCTRNGSTNGTTLTIEKYAFYQDRVSTDEYTHEHTDEHTDEHTREPHQKKGKERKRIAKNARARGEGISFEELAEQMEREAAENES